MPPRTKKKNNSKAAAESRRKSPRKKTSEADVQSSSQQHEEEAANEPEGVGSADAEAPSKTVPKSPSNEHHATAILPEPPRQAQEVAGSLDARSEDDDIDIDKDDDDDDLDAVAASSNSLHDRLSRLQQLRVRMHQTETESRKDLIHEQNNKRLPVALQRKLERKRTEALELQQRIDMKTSGEDYDRLRNLNYSIQDVEAWEVAQVKKRERANTGATDTAQAAHKKYKSMISQLKPDLAGYQAQKIAAEVQGEAASFYGDTNALDVKVKSSTESVHRMVDNLNKQIEIRNNRSRRRVYDPNEDVSFINDKNRTFNQKISRAYDKYTTEIKESLERGTAL